MFVIVTLEETVRIMPNKLHLPQRDVISDDLNDKLANKVIVDVGLCITLYDILQVGESFLRQGDPAAHTHVKFRFVVFRPFVGETLVGRVRSCSRDGVCVSLGFFDNILISPEYLPEPHKFVEKEQLWVWEYVDEESQQKHDMMMEVGESIRFKVRDEVFKDTSPAGPSRPEIATDDRNKKVAYSLTGTCVESGLGLISWWK